MVFMGRRDASAKRQPFSDRLAGAPLKDTLFEGVPSHLVLPLGDWIATALTDDLARRVCLRLHLPRYLATELPRKVDASKYLDVIDMMLWLGLSDVPTNGMPESIADLARGYGVIPAPELLLILHEILADGSSAYRLNENGDGLEQRVDRIVTYAAILAMKAAKTVGRTEAAKLLSDSWSRTYGRRADPGEAYADAIKAVEEVACPLFLPNEHEPSLGKVRAHLDQGRARYELVIDGRDARPAPIDAVVEMVGLLWHGQRERHGGGPTTAPIRQDAAEAALHLAVTLVHWFSVGAVRRKQ